MDLYIKKLFNPLEKFCVSYMNLEDHNEPVLMSQHLHVTVFSIVLYEVERNGSRLNF